MDETIAYALDRHIGSDARFDGLIMSGEAIRVLREQIGDCATRDGFHLNELGRLCAALTWSASLADLEGRAYEAPARTALPEAWQEELGPHYDALCRAALAGAAWGRAARIFYGQPPEGHFGAYRDAMTAASAEPDAVAPERREDWARYAAAVRQLAP